MFRLQSLLPPLPAKATSSPSLEVLTLVLRVVQNPEAHVIYNGTPMPARQFADLMLKETAHILMSAAVLCAPGKENADDPVP